MISLIENEFIKLGKLKIIIPFILFTIVLLIENYVLKSINYNNLVSLIPFISITLIIIFCGIISNEIEYGTFRMYLTKSKSRRKVYLSKLLTSYIYTLILTVYIFFIYSIISRIFIFKLFIKYLLYTIPLYFIVSLTIMFSNIIKSTPINAGLCIFISIFSGLISEFLLKIILSLLSIPFCLIWIILYS